MRRNESKKTAGLSKSVTVFDSEIDYFYLDRIASHPLSSDLMEKIETILTDVIDELHVQDKANTHQLDEHSPQCLTQ